MPNIIKYISQLRFNYQLTNLNGATTGDFFFGGGEYVS